MFSHQFKQQADSSNHLLKCHHCSSRHLCSHSCSFLTRHQHAGQARVGTCKSIRQQLTESSVHSM